MQVGIRGGVTYLFDVLSIPGCLSSDCPLRALLEDPTVSMLMYDPRNDADALHHLHGVTLRSVLDLQVNESCTTTICWLGSLKHYVIGRSCSCVHKRSPANFFRGWARQCHLAAATRIDTWLCTGTCSHAACSRCIAGV